MKLYPRSAVIDTKMRAQIADAAFFLGQAAAALHVGDILATQEFMVQASDILPVLTRRRINQKNKRAAQKECIQRFAERFLEMRPKGGWKNVDHAAHAGKTVLQALLREYKHTFGLLWKIDARALIVQWLEQEQPDVYKAYQGISSNPLAN